MGGISNYSDAVEFMLAGADAFSIGTANFIDPVVCQKVLDDLTLYMKRNNINCIKDIVGKVIR